MDLATVSRRLTALAGPLPHGTHAVDPVLIGRPADLPAWTRSGPATTRRAAALVLLYPDSAGVVRIVLTERPHGLRHAGQVSFPGGKEDPGDDFPDGTALREATEEVGLDVLLAGVRVVGRLEVVDVRVTGFMLTPVVALADREPALIGSVQEVASILLPSVDIFLPDAPLTTEELERDGYVVRYAGYPFEGRHVWGATARALAQLGAILAGDGS